MQIKKLHSWMQSNLSWKICNKKKKSNKRYQYATAFFYTDLATIFLQTLNFFYTLCQLLILCLKSQWSKKKYCAQTSITTQMFHSPPNPYCPVYKYKSFSCFHAFENSCHHINQQRAMYTLQQNKKKQNYKQRTTTVIYHLANQYAIAAYPLPDMPKP